MTAHGVQCEGTRDIRLFMGGPGRPRAGSADDSEGRDNWAKPPASEAVDVAETKAGGTCITLTAYNLRAESSALACMQTEGWGWRRGEDEG